MARHSFSHLLEYIPVRYQGLSAKQLQDRKDVYNFKDGAAPESVKVGLVSKIRSITCSNPAQWLVCFIPASTRAKTYKRYASLARYLSAETGCYVNIDSIVNTMDTESGHKTGKCNNPTEFFSIDGDAVRGKKIILIDDVITRGRTFDDSADKLLRSGAATVQGLFVAKTIHPNLPQASRGSYGYDEAYDIFDGMMEDELAEEMALYDEGYMEEDLGCCEEAYDEYEEAYEEYYDPVDFY